MLPEGRVTEAHGVCFTQGSSYMGWLPGGMGFHFISYDRTPYSVLRLVEVVARTSVRTAKIVLMSMEYPKGSRNQLLRARFWAWTPALDWHITTEIGKTSPSIHPAY